MKIHGVLSLAAALAFALAGCTMEKAPSSTGAQFAGSEACSGCHQAHYQTWKETYHSKMVRTRQDGLLKQSGEAWVFRDVLN